MLIKNHFEQYLALKHLNLMVKNMFKSLSGFQSYFQFVHKYTTSLCLSIWRNEVQLKWDSIIRKHQAFVPLLICCLYWILRFKKSLLCILYSLILDLSHCFVIIYIYILVCLSQIFFLWEQCQHPSLPFFYS